ncbi:MAG TPA: hypothetical protein VF472_22630 [Burkholderiaceae bacterium]
MAADLGTQAETHPLHLASHYRHAVQDWNEAVEEWWRREIKPAPRFASATPSCGRRGRAVVNQPSMASAFT